MELVAWVLGVLAYFWVGMRVAVRTMNNSNAKAGHPPVDINDDFEAGFALFFACFWPVLAVGPIFMFLGRLLLVIPRAFVPRGSR